MRLDELMVLAEMPEPEPREYDLHETAAGQTRLPVNGKRRPIDPGFVLTWTERRREARPFQKGEQRQGMVLGLAPFTESVWVVPDERRDGEGYAVVVRQVVAADASRATRWVEGPGDYLSTAQWQAPRTLPRALLRVDRHQESDGSLTQPLYFLHARPDCPFPFPFPGEKIVRGEPELVEECYVFRGHLHPASVRMQHPSQGTWVPVCGWCLHIGKPS